LETQLEKNTNLSSIMQQSSHHKEYELMHRSLLEHGFESMHLRGMRILPSCGMANQADRSPSLP
jgi:hypothetical protein